MNRRARTILLMLFAVTFLGNSLAAQVVILPTPNPTVTAENEAWYLNGEPITHAGNVYYPAGPLVPFNHNEMVRSGFYQGIPLYSRTTIEPYSVVYVPVGRALMQPYERPRTGPLAETAGSLPSSLPPTPARTAPGEPVLQAAGPPSQTTIEIPMQVPVPAGTAGVEGRSAREPETRPVGTSGRTPEPRRPTHTQIGGRPQGSNSIFIEIDGVRWYKAGPAEAIDTAKMTRAGSYRGIPVWSRPGADDGIIYVPVTQGGGSLAVPYSRKK